MISYPRSLDILLFISFCNYFFSIWNISRCYVLFFGSALILTVKETELLFRISTCRHFFLRYFLIVIQHTISSQMSCSDVFIKVSTESHAVWVASIFSGLQEIVNIALGWSKCKNPELLGNNCCPLVMLP